jgi:hypothetical protein
MEMDLLKSLCRLSECPFLADGVFLLKCDQNVFGIKQRDKHTLITKNSSVQCPEYVKYVFCCTPYSTPGTTKGMTKV